MVDTLVRVDPPNRRCAATRNGTRATSSSLELPDDPVDCSTPTTCNSTPLTVTVSPTALVRGNSSSAVVAPNTVTAVPFVSSAAVRNRPLSSVRARTRSQESFVPTTLVVQFVDAAVNDAEVEVVGATAAMSGATVFDASASASAVVSVDADPKPPRTPPVLVWLPG